MFVLIYFFFVIKMKTFLIRKFFEFMGSGGNIYKLTGAHILQFEKLRASYFQI